MVLVKSALPPLAILADARARRRAALRAATALRPRWNCMLDFMVSCLVSVRLPFFVCFRSMATWTRDWVIRRPRVLFRPEGARRPGGGVPLEERVMPEG